MKVLLLSDVYKHGVAGEVVEVADGFARNWLIPKKLAVKATPGALKQAESLRAQAEARRAQLDARLNELARQIDGVELIFARRASPTGRLFGSVTTTEIAEALNEKTGIDINRRRISQQPLRDIGTHEVPVRLGTEISPVLRITIVREEDYERFMREREQSQQAETAGGAVGELAEAVAEAAGNVVEGISNAVASAVDAVRDALPGQEADDQGGDQGADEETRAAD
ncbi:MAG: 50S ribosomal protein L9 [Chloroflexota bacterium]|nr:MAG: 50S ribosomal protein L9 [Chloroflexota bacterium]